MKKLLITLLFMAFSSVGYANDFQTICRTDFSGSIAASGFEYGEVTKVRGTIPFQGYFSLQPFYTGGTLKVEYQRSNDGITYADPVLVTVSDDGLYDYPVTGVSIFAGYIRLKYSETGGSTAITMTKAQKCEQ